MPQGVDGMNGADTSNETVDQGRRRALARLGLAVGVGVVGYLAYSYFKPSTARPILPGVPRSRMNPNMACVLLKRG